jgi:hypothetical protein
MAEDPGSEARLTPDVVSMLVGGVANARSDSDRGQEGILGRRQAMASAQALLTMDDAQYEQTASMLSQAGHDREGGAIEGADAAAEQALILKAVASRSERLDTNVFEDIWSFFGGETDADVAMAEIRQFSEDIRGMDRRELIRQTTLADVHDENDSTVDPDAIAANSDTVGDNDGLFQRFEDSCGPTTAQILRGEADPIYALRVHQGGIANADPHSATAEEQRRVLEANGGGAVARLGTQAQTSMTTTMDTMQAAGTLTADQRSSVMTLVSDPGSLGEEDRAAANANLELVRAQNGGHPTAQELSAMQEDAGQVSDGMALDPALNDITTPGTHIDYAVSSADFEANPAELDAVAARLEGGEDVPFRIGYTGDGGHFMSITDVRTDAAGNRRFLVSDPYSGATRWVSSADLSSGAAFDSTFSLGSATVTHTYGQGD